MDHGSVRSSRNAGRGSDATAEWNASPAEMISTQRPGSCRPCRNVIAYHPSTVRVPSVDMTAVGTRNAVCACNESKRDACQSSWARGTSTGFSTASPTRHACPRPPGMSRGWPSSENEPRTDRGGAGDGSDRSMAVILIHEPRIRSSKLSHGGGPLLGSLAHDEGDRWSDLDIMFAVVDDVPVTEVLDA